MPTREISLNADQARAILDADGIEVSLSEMTWLRDVVLRTGAKLYKSSRNEYFVAGYAQDGSDVLPYRSYAC